jgi:hypothetical protein
MEKFTTAADAVEIQKFESALEYVVDGNPIFDVNSRDDYIKVMMAAHSADPSPDGEFCRVARQWSQRGRTYRDQDFDKDWASFREVPNGVTLGSIFHRAREAGWTPPQDQGEADVERVRRLWSSFEECYDGRASGYLQNKGLPTPLNVRVSRDCSFFPFVRLDGEVHGVLAVPDDGAKKMLKGSQAKGSFYCSAHPDDFAEVRTFFIAEGVATALAVEHAHWTLDRAACETPPNGYGISFPTKAFVAAGSRTNIKDVAWDIRRRYPAAEIVIAGDDEGLDGAGGRKSAERAAREVPGCKLAFPRFAAGNAKERSDYCDLLALEGPTAVVEQLRGAAYPVPEVEAKGLALEEFSVRRFTDTPPPERKFVIEDVVPTPIAGMVFAPGDTYKTMFAMQAMGSVSTGLPFLGDFKIPSPGKTLGIFCEDDAPELHRRLWRVMRGFADDDESKLMEIKDLLNENLLIQSRAGKNSRLISKQRNRVDRTAFFKALVDFASSIEELKLIIFDSLARSHDLNENDNAEMTSVVETFEELKERTGATILVLHHSSKATLRGGEVSQAGSRGASSTIDTFRLGIQLRRMDKREFPRTDSNKWVQMAVVKSNYGPRMDAWLHVDRNGFLYRSDPGKADVDALLSKIKALIEEDARNDRLWTISGFVRQYGGVSGPFGVGKDRLEAEVRNGLAKCWFGLENKTEAAVRFPKAVWGHKNNQLLLAPNETAEVIEFPRKGA